MVVAANYHESTWTATVRDTLNRIFAMPLNWEVPQARFGKKPDAINFGDTPFFVVEVKNDAGLDASLQAALSYSHITIEHHLLNHSTFFVFVIHFY